MATITKVTHGQGSGADPTINIDLGAPYAGRLILCAVSNEDGSSGVFATDCKASGGTSMAEEAGARAEQTVQTSRHKAQLFWIEDETSTGVTSFDITIANSDATNLDVYEISGANTASPIGAVQVNEASNTDQTFSLTTTTADSLIVCCTIGENDPAVAASGITEDINVIFQFDEIIFCGSRSAATATSYTVGCTIDGNSFSAGAASWAVEILADGATEHALTATGISAPSSVGSPAIGQEHALTPTGVLAASSVGSPALGQEHALTASDITAPSSVGSPVLGVAHGLIAQGIASPSSVGSPSIEQTHVLSARSILAASAVGSPALGQIHDLVPQGISAPSSVGSPNLDAFFELSAVGISAPSSVGSPAIGQEHALSPSGVAAASFVGSPALQSIHALSPRSITATSSVGAPTLGTQSDLVASSISSPSSVGSPQLVEIPAYSLTEIVQTPSLDAAVVLWTLDLTLLGGTLLRFTLGPVDGQPVVFDGETYPPVPIDADGFEWSGQGPMPTPRLQISNINLVMSGLVQEFQDLVGATVTRLRTLKRFLDGQAFADPSAHFPPDIYRVERKSAQTKISIEWELAAAMDQEGRKVPGRQVTRLCTHRYRVWNPVTETFDYSKATCPYVGAQSYDRFGNPVSSGADDVCSKQLESGCKVHFGENAVLPFRGFPGVARVRG